jgi:5-methyltetrahydrofolate--homocysteine methyltransferase
VNNEVLPAYAKIKAEALAEGLLQPQVAYGYFNCRSEGDELVLEDSGRDYRFGFPRQGFAPNLCISDFFRSREEGGDLAGLFVVTLGPQLAEKTRALYEADHYKDYLLWHGFGVELTDALAEYWHMQMRRELGIAQGEPKDVAGYVVQQYRGSRYGFGDPACPTLELQRPTFELLRPERIGVSLTENCEMVPEMTTSALVAHHPQAKYFAV